MIKNIKNPLDISTRSIIILTRKKVTYENYGYADSLYFAKKWRRNLDYVMGQIAHRNKRYTVARS